MAEICIDRWHEWNDHFKDTLYHEVGFLMLCRQALTSDHQKFERSSYEHLLAAGYQADRLSAQDLRRRFPAVNTEQYVEGIYNPRAGYVESGRVVHTLAGYARQLGVRIYEGQTAAEILMDKGRVQGVRTREGESYHCGHAIIAAGAFTPWLLPELQPYMKATGHPVFWLKPSKPALFQTPNLSVFTADISNTGWYGFPWIPDKGIVKVAKHTNGLTLDPEKDDRRVTDSEVDEMRDFLRTTFPTLAEAPLVYTRRCLYTDTLDGHFWIDRHPETEGLSVSSGGSGHGMKMAPLLGEMTADVAEGKSHRFSQRYRWRHLTPETSQAEEARFVVDRRI